MDEGRTRRRKLKKKLNVSICKRMHAEDEKEEEHTNNAAASGPPTLLSLLMVSEIYHTKAQMSSLSAMKLSRTLSAL